MVFGLITSWHIDGETLETVTEFIFGGFKITADGDCSHEIKRHLFLGRKVMTNQQLKLPELSQWCHLTISFPAVPFSSCPQSFQASESFPINWLFASSGQSIGVSALASVLPMNTQDWSPLEWTGWNSLQSKGLSRVFSNTTVQKHQFFGAQLSSQSNSHIHTWPQEKP